MRHTPGELRDIHAAFGTARQRIDRRRSLFSAVAELGSGGAAADCTPDELDSPLVRAHLIEVINGAAFRPDAMVPVSVLARDSHAFRSGSAQTYIPAEPAACAQLVGVLDVIARNLGDADAESAGLRFLSRADPEFDALSGRVIDGLSLVADYCPELTDDLLPHVALIGLLAPGDRVARLGSASARECPGVIVVPPPTSPIEAAEAVVHEGAHQAFFDICLERAVFAGAFWAPYRRPSWKPANTPAWSFERCFAAFHAYTALAAFGASVPDLRPPAGSLLPFAEKRADELGEGLARGSEFLGSDGRQLVALLRGAPRPAGEVGPDTGVAPAPSDRLRAIRRCGDVTLVAELTDRMVLHWVPSRAPVPPSGNS